MTDPSEHKDKSREDLVREVDELRMQVKRLEAQNRQLAWAELELAESEARLQSIVDNTTAVIYVKDLDGRYFLINRRYEELFKVDRERIVGETDNAIFPDEIAEAFRANDRKVIEAKGPLEFEEVATQEDGPHTYISIKFPLHDASGNIYAVCGISTDITDRKKYEEELEEELRESRAFRVQVEKKEDST